MRETVFVKLLKQSQTSDFIQLLELLVLFWLFIFNSRLQNLQF